MRFVENNRFTYGSFISFRSATKFYLVVYVRHSNHLNFKLTSSKTEISFFDHLFADSILEYTDLIL